MGIHTSVGGVTVKLNANQKLLLLALREMRDHERYLQMLHSRCQSCDLNSVLAFQRRKLLCMQWEGRHLAVQRGVELPDTPGMLPILFFPRRCSDSRIAHSWTIRNQEARSRCGSALRRYPYTDPASVFCRKFLDFCATAMDQMEPFLRQ